MIHYRNSLFPWDKIPNTSAVMEICTSSPIGINIFPCAHNANAWFQMAFLALYLQYVSANCRWMLHLYWAAHDAFRGAAPPPSCGLRRCAACRSDRLSSCPMRGGGWRRGWVNPDPDTSVPSAGQMNSPSPSLPCYVPHAVTNPSSWTIIVTNQRSRLKRIWCLLLISVIMRKQILCKCLVNKCCDLLSFAGLAVSRCLCSCVCAPMRLCVMLTCLIMMPDHNLHSFPGLSHTHLNLLLIV